MGLFKHLFSIALALTLAACGGGGGNSGTASGIGAGTGSSTSVDTFLKLDLRSSGGLAIQTLDASSTVDLVVSLMTKEGAPVAGQTVAVSNSSGNLTSFPNGKSAVTDASGVAKIQVKRLNLFEFGTDLVTVNFLASGNLLSSSSTIDLRVAPPVLSLSLTDASNSTTSSIGSSGVTSINATLRFADGTPVVQKRIDITGDPTKVSFPEGSSQLTNSNGTAVIRVARTSLSGGGAGTLSGAATISGVTTTGTTSATVVTGATDYTLGVANIALTDLNVGNTSLNAFGNRPITVKATINGAIATNTAVQISFGASCGTVSPATAFTDSNGLANVTYTASSSSCAGSNVTVSASAVGANSISGTILVSSPVATNVQFVSTNPQLIYLKDSVGVTQAQVTFKVVDAIGTPIQNKRVRISLSNTATGISLNRIGNSSPVDLTTNSDGIAVASVFSGTVPTSLNVKAVILDSNDAESAVFTTSNLLTVASGRPTQRSLSLAFGKLSLEGLNFDGDTTTVSLSMADRQGNPVPPGTQVNFVSESGVLLPAVCFVPPASPSTASSTATPTSSCTVSIRTSGTRPSNGRVSVLAYVAGEEDFVDANGNNVFDAGEAFTDLGRAFRDDNSQAAAGSNGRYDSGEFQVPRDGVPACSSNGQCIGDGVWGTADVRSQGTLIFASGVAVISGTATKTSLDVKIEDVNGNSVPTGSKVVVSVIKGSSASKCAINGAPDFVIASTLVPTSGSFSFFDCVSGEGADVTVTTPLGLITRKSFIFP